MAEAQLHPRLLADTGAVMETPAYWLRWMNDRRFAWLIIVPRVADITEWHQLPPSAQHDLLDTVNECAGHLQRVTGAQKMNIGALGNLVPQLHIHVIARNPGDPCWPGPVWGQGEVQPWPAGEQPDWLESFRHA